MIKGLDADIRSEVTSVTQYIEYDPPEINIAEMMRYAGFPMPLARKMAQGQYDDPEVGSLKDRAIDLVRGQLKYLVGYRFIRLERKDGYPILPFEQHSEDLRKNLKDCDSCIMFAATVGAGIDRLIRRYEKTDRSLGLCLQGLGAERVESLCNTFNLEVKEIAAKEGFKSHARFSPGFGDLPITVQRDFLKTLDAERRMGITLSESYLMAPSKSVTAIIGLEARDNI